MLTRSRCHLLRCRNVRTVPLFGALLRLYLPSETLRHPRLPIPDRLLACLHCLRWLLFRIVSAELKDRAPSARSLNFLPSSRYDFMSYLPSPFGAAVKDPTFQTRLVHVIDSPNQPNIGASNVGNTEKTQRSTNRSLITHFGFSPAEQRPSQWYNIIYNI